ncbi:twin-arginine translocation signal domain-containing protein [Vibrio cholerae]|nr:twin-arginine translocation signal domain-containing protein [Vibrio cholerae]
MTKITRRGFLKGTGMAAGAMAFTSFSPLSVASDNARGKGVLTAGRMGHFSVKCKMAKWWRPKMRWRKPYRTACNRQALIRCIPKRGLNTLWFVKAF